MNEWMNGLIEWKRETSSEPNNLAIGRRVVVNILRSLARSFIGASRDVDRGKRLPPALLFSHSLKTFTKR